MNALQEILNSGEVSEKTRKMVESLERTGKLALEAYYDETSDFYQHAKSELIADRFSLNISSEKDIFLYHYTSISSFEKILRSGNFLMTSIYYENDPKEMRYTCDLVCVALEEMGAGIEIREIFKKLFQTPIFDSYVWSFSLNAASQALQNYGEIALGFDAQSLGDDLSKQFEIKDYEATANDQGFVMLLKVEYDRDIQMEYIRPIAREWWYAYQNIDKDPDDMGNLIQICLGVTAILSICFKQPILRQEEEVRFVVMHAIEDNKLHPDNYMNEKPVISAKIAPALLNKVIVTHKAKERQNEVKQILEEKWF